jgi:cell division protein FtsW (lipid II flippase)
MNRTARLEATLLWAGFLFQAFGAAALLLAPSVQDGVWTLYRPYLSILAPLIAWSALAVIVHLQLNRLLPERDPLLFPSAMFLSGWGLQILVRLSPATALRQTLWLVVACAILLLILRLPHDLEWLRKYRYLWLIAALASLAATFVIGIGSEPNSPKLWLGFAGVYFQPSEFLRWVFPVFAVFTLSGKSVLKRNRILPVLLFAAVALVLLLLQPDLGAILLLLGSLILVLYLAYPKFILLAAGGGTALLGGWLGYRFDDTVRARILTWWNPWLDATNTSYQVVQSLIAFAAGGLIGRGPGLGAPGVVPVAYSDFIFTALGEEYGVVGAIGCLLIIAVLVLRGLRVAARSTDPAGRLLAGSLSALLGLQSILIIGGVLRLLPLTGVTLPWMSYGGSSLVSCAVILALLLVLSGKTQAGHLSAQEIGPLKVLASLQIFAVLAAAVSLGWWGIYRAPVLRTRTDNVRRVLHDLRIRRGNLYDRSGTPLAQTTGAPGGYAREYPDPAAAPVVGYSSPRFGQGGMEGALDPWLRGEASRDVFEIWWSETVLGQGAEGSSAWLTVDRALQDAGSQLLDGRTGAIVVMLARRGDILALVTEPTYNPATLETDWDSLLDNPRSPLLDRATQGLYPPGAMLLPFLASESLEKGWLEPAGGLCDLPVETLLVENPDLLPLTLERFRFNQAPEMDLPAAHSPVGTLPRTAAALFPEPGREGGILLSPMQIALALSSLAGDGMAPAPVLSLWLETPSGWIPGSAPGHPLAMTTADIAAGTLAMIRNGEPLNEDVELPQCAPPLPEQTDISWFAGFRPAGDDSIVVVVVMEGNYLDADTIGREMLARAEEMLHTPAVEPTSAPSAEK